MAINEAETPGIRDEGMNAEALQAQERPVGWSLLDCRSCITMFVARFLFALPRRRLVTSSRLSLHQIPSVQASEHDPLTLISLALSSAPSIVLP